MLNHQRWMQEAIKEAKRAFFSDEVPIGAVVVFEAQVIGKGHNMTEQLKDATAHAEMIALTAAMETTGKKFLTDCALYVTIEPCLMCMGALLNCRISYLIYGAAEPKTGFFSLGYQLPTFHALSVVSGVEAEEARALMQSFFQKKRSIQRG